VINHLETVSDPAPFVRLGINFIEGLRINSVAGAQRLEGKQKYVWKRYPFQDPVSLLNNKRATHQVALLLFIYCHCEPLLVGRGNLP